MPNLRPRSDVAHALQRAGSTLVWTLAALSAMVLGAWALSQNIPARHPTPGTEGVTLLVTFGLQARSVERWDGSVHVSGGRLVSLEERQFSAGDRITASDRWVSTTRQDQVVPYADIHYTEMRPGAPPP